MEQQNARAPLTPENINLNNDQNDALRIAALAEKEDQDLQAALALSMGLPVPPKFGDSVAAIEPLPANEALSSCEEIPSDLLATAAVVAATAPALGNLHTNTTPAGSPMRIESSSSNNNNNNNNHDNAMETSDDDDRKPAAKPTSPKSLSPSRILKTNPHHFSGRVRTWYETASPYNILEFHDCMWTKGVTTENDQKRWLSQGIQFKDETHPKTRATNPNASTSLLETIISGPGVWCLTQQHGGPCGVLASIQAELLAILLFGPREVHPISMISIDFPDDLSAEFTRAPPNLSRPKMRQILALSMGMILARASLMLGASDEKEEDAMFALSEPCVRLILPKNELWDTTTCLEWEHLSPWNGSSSGISEHFLAYSVSLHQQPQFSGGENNSAVKRQKRGSINVEHTCKELAHATAQFLLETNSLNWFQRPGGVLLMVMSMCASRGITKTQSDMDDLTARLTSNFGHCSQELINLLLTGQAVSNVFDHTLRPSGELVCRGIQSQPAIGYLTQLEALRYLEVGAFYKSPRFPVWVIGSSSHFTVMFGDANALKESASDALLEKVRRAFKRMEGGAEENGFIQTHQLGDFLKSLDLTSIKDHEVQTLAAFLDRYGAGIILWEDLWKRTSRLLTGASLESILDGTDEASTNNTSNVASAPEATNNVAMSDEELARKLQAEWNDEVEILPASSLVNVFDEKTTQTTTSSNSSSNPTETFGHTFRLYHYNGLRGGNFKAFSVTRLSADEAIGASISLGGDASAGAGFGGGGELDAVLRTKWPSCKIDWLHGLPPSID